MCRSRKKVVSVWKTIMSYNKRFTNRVTRSVLEIRSPHFYARPSQAQAVQKRSGFVFPSTDRVTRLVNRYQCSSQHMNRNLWAKRELKFSFLLLLLDWADTKWMSRNYEIWNSTMSSKNNVTILLCLQMLNLNYIHSCYLVIFSGVFVWGFLSGSYIRGLSRRFLSWNHSKWIQNE